MERFFTKDFVLDSNGERYNYQKFKKAESDIYANLKSFEVTRIDDIFSAGDKVVSRMWMKLVNKNGKIQEFQVLAIFQMKDGKIDKIWELTNPTWSDKYDIKVR